MDSELLDCFTPPVHTGHEDRRLSTQVSCFSDRSDAPLSDAASGMPASASATGQCAQDAVEALGRSLTAQMRADCQKRAEKRALAGPGDISDPCVCGEARLLFEAAQRGGGRAPAACFETMGGVR